MTLQHTLLLLTLGSTAFLAATILPFSSEAALAATLAFGIKPFYVLIVASLGNCLACWVNYAIGKWFYHRFEKKLQEHKRFMQAVKIVNKNILLALLLSWLPIIGDPITIACGVLQIPQRLCLPVIFGLRVARYIVIIVFADWVSSVPLLFA
jgi:membrane protein YqaA with SNARE-associated domain